MYPGNSRRARVACALVLCAVTGSATALQVGGDVSVDTRYTDNANLVPTLEQSDLITTARVAATASEVDGPLTGDATVTLRQLDYRDNTFGDQTYLQLGSSARWEQFNNRLVWAMDDYFTQTAIDNLASITPSNVQDTNAFSLSATVTLPVSGRHVVTITPAFRDFYYESTGNDNQQLILGAAWDYQVNPTTTLSLNGSFGEVDFDDNTANPDYERTSLNLATAITRARSRYGASVGFTRVERSMGADFDGVSGSLSWEHDFTGRSSIIALASSDITDSSNIFLTSSINPNTGSFGNVQTSSATVRDSVFRLTYNRTGAPVDSSIWTELRDLDYDSASLTDRKVQEVGVRISYPITALVTGEANGTFTRTKDSTTTDKRYLLGGRVSYQLSRKLSANVGLQLRKKDSSGVPGREYDEMSVSAGIGYRLGR